MHTYLLITSFLSILTAAAPLIERAGGPIAKPIPKACTAINPLPHANCGTANVDSWMPESSFVKQSLLYQAYFTSSLTQADQAKQCKQQCYGYGNPGQCKSSLVGYQIPTPRNYEGTAGGDLETACLLFSTYMDPNSFVKAPDGQYANATAANIYCPSS